MFLIRIVILLSAILSQILCSLAYPKPVSPLFLTHISGNHRMKPKLLYVPSQKYYIVAFDVYPFHSKILAECYSVDDYEMVGERIEIIQDFETDVDDSSKFIMVLIDDERVLVVFNHEKDDKEEIYGQFFNTLDDGLEYQGDKFKINLNHFPDDYMLIRLVAATKISMLYTAVVYRTHIDGNDVYAARVISNDDEEVFGNEHIIIDDVSGNQYDKIAADTIYGENGFVLGGSFYDYPINMFFGIFTMNAEGTSFEEIHSEEILERSSIKISIINTDNDFAVLWPDGNTIHYQCFSSTGKKIGDQLSIENVGFSDYYHITRLRENVLIFVYAGSNGNFYGRIFDKDNSHLNESFYIHDDDGDYPYVIPIDENRFAVAWTGSVYTDNVYSRVYYYDLDGYEFVDYDKKYKDYYKKFPFSYYWHFYKELIKYFLVLFYLFLIMMFIIFINSDNARFKRFKSKDALQEKFKNVTFEMKSPGSYLLYYFFEPSVMFFALQKDLISGKAGSSLVLTYLLCCLMYILFPLSVIIFYVLCFYRGILDIPKFKTKDNYNEMGIVFDILLGLLLLIILLLSYVTLPFLIIGIFINGYCPCCCIGKISEIKQNQTDIDV